RYVAFRRMTVTAAQQPNGNSRPNMVNPIQGYA
ncbi:MAG: hypothetical protein QOE78_137, partial [Alphaproteobacteria bacterium]|nr:hypothetical protein [Alphaproteobacteria bacterium]